MKKIINWFNEHWYKLSFKIFICFTLIVTYLEIFHHADFVQFIQFMLLVILKDIITKLANNDAIITALSVAIVGILGALFKKNDKK